MGITSGNSFLLVGDSSIKKESMYFQRKLLKGSISRNQRKWAIGGIEDVSLSISKYQEHGILFGPLMFHAGFQYRVIDVYREERTQGRSGYTFSKRLNLAINSLVSYTDLPYRWMLNLGLATILGSLIYAILVVLFYLLNRDVLLPGLNLIVFLLTLIFGTMMIGLGVIGIYVFRIYQEVLRRPRYLIEDTLNFFDS